MIFVVLALVWAIYLIPKTLKHHDELARTRSVEEVSDSARVLRGRSTVASRVRWFHRTGSTKVDLTKVDSRSVGSSRAQPASAEVPAQSSARIQLPPAEPRVPRQPHPQLHPQLHPEAVGPRGTQEPQGAGATRVTTPRAAAARAARRRRRILLGLVAATVIVTVLAAVGVLDVWAPLIPIATIAAFLVLCRVLVRRERARWAARRRTAGAPAPSPAAAREGAEPGPVVEPVAPRAEITESGGAGVVPQPQVGTREDTTALRALVPQEPAQDADPGAVGGGSTLWDPLPVTLPTYVGKPRAVRSVRTIDLGDSGVSSSGHDPADSALVDSEAGPTGNGTGGQRVAGG